MDIDIVATSQPISIQFSLGQLSNINRQMRSMDRPTGILRFFLDNGQTSLFLCYLISALTEEGLQAGFIASPTPSRTADLMADFSEDELKEWQYGVRVGVENNDWSNLVAHPKLRADVVAMIPHIPNPQTSPGPAQPRLAPITSQKSPPKSSATLDALVHDFLEKLRPRMRYLVENANNVPALLPSWHLDRSQELAEHVAGLRIPTVSNGKPSLLLHDLGEERYKLDQERIARISDIFSFATHTVLVNTTGSGKTRLMLDALCHRWGFYFVVKPDSSGIGSDDIWTMMNELDDVQDYSKAKTAERRLAQVLLARILILDLLVQEAQNLPDGLQLKAHRRLWVLLQVQPQILGEDGVDVFTDLSRTPQYSSLSGITERIEWKYMDLRFILDDVQNPATRQLERPPFFCVVDEAQFGTTPHRGESMSCKEKPGPSMLQQIWEVWSTVLPHQMRLVLSGTGIDHQDANGAFNSAFSKQHSYELKFDAGTFDDYDSQVEYIKHYISANWDNPNWKEFLRRAYHWFHGRYRNTATLVLLVLAGGYHCPHRTIDAYVEAFTDFHPTDGQNWTVQEPLLVGDFVKSQITRLDFTKMDKSHAKKLSDVIYDHILNGRYELGEFTSQERAMFIEYGFARRRPGVGETVFDEPMAVLAALAWVNQNAQSSIMEHDVEPNSKRSKSFETYLASICV